LLPCTFSFQARNNSITVFAVGVTHKVAENEINEIANDPDSTHAFNLEQFDELVSVLKK